MSNEVSSIAQKRKIGSATRKAVLMYLSDRASDDGSGIWTSKAHIAADTEMSKRSVQNAMLDFEKSGLLKRVGKRSCNNGFTLEYSLDLTTLKSLPSTRKLTGAGGSPVQEIHLTGAGGSPQDVQEIHPNHPLTTLEPSNPPNPQGNDLFSANEGPIEQDEAEVAEKYIKESFDAFWDNIWPKHSRKTGKAKCFEVYRKACLGKIKGVDQVPSDDLNAATRAYIRQERDNHNLKYLKGPLPWLRLPGWEPFLDESQTLDPDQERYRRLAKLYKG